MTSGHVKPLREGVRPSWARNVVFLNPQPLKTHMTKTDCLIEFIPIKS